MVRIVHTQEIMQLPNMMVHMFYIEGTNATSKHVTQCRQGTLAK